MPASQPKDIRNLVLLGHGGSGKTTLGEAMLHAAGVSSRLGSTGDGTSVLDWSELEKEREHSVDPALAHVDHAGKTINILDAPGYPDFIGGAIAAMGGADVGVVVVSATAGIEVNTRRLLNAAKDAGMPLAVVINKIDGENVDLGAVLSAIGETFGQACRPMTLPADGGKKVVDCFTNDSGDADMGDVAEAHTELTENIIEADEELMEAYLGGEEVAPERLAAAFARAMIEHTAVPVFFMAAREEIGVKEFMDAAASYFPSPADVKPREVRTGTGEDAEAVEISADAGKPFVGQAFKITADPFVGKLSWIRILQGTATPDTSFAVRDEKKSSKIAHMFKVQGKETDEVKQAVAGDIIALAKVEEIEYGDVLHEESKPMFCRPVPAPTPMYSLAVTPKSRGDEQKISEALTRLSEEDPTFVASRDTQTNETVISGIGDLHLRIMLTKMKSRLCELVLIF